jgi:hypothetical protein
MQISLCAQGSIKYDFKMSINIVHIQIMSYDKRHGPFHVLSFLNASPK